MVRFRQKDHSSKSASLGTFSLALACLGFCIFSGQDVFAAEAQTGSVADPGGTVSFESRLEAGYNNVSGPGSSASFYEDGFYYNEEVDFLAEKENVFRDYSSRLQFNVRLTDDDRFDSEKTSVEKFQWTLKNSKNEITLGDYFAVFSQYTFSKSIKGAGFQHNFTDDQNYVRVAYGTFDNQWEFLYKDPSGNIEPMNRYGGGVRYQKAENRYTIGFNLAYVDDDQSDSNRGTADAYRQGVGSVDWEYRGDSFRLQAEHAYSSTEKESILGLDDNLYGSANKIKLKSDIAKFGVLAKFENVTPDFVTLGGGATPDRRRYSLNITRQLAKRWFLVAAFNQSHNKLSGSSETTRTTYDTYEAGVTKKRLFGRKRMRGSLKFYRKISSSDNSTIDRTKDRLKISISDTLKKVYRYRVNLQYTLRDDDAASLDQETWLYSIDLDSRHRMGKTWSVRPSLFVSRQDADSLTAGGQDLTTNVRVGIQASDPLHTLGTSYEYIELDLSSGTDSTTTRVNAYWQRSLDLPILQNSSCRLDYKYNDYEFTEDVPDRDYTENLFAFSFQFKW